MKKTLAMVLAMGMTIARPDSMAAEASRQRRLLAATGAQTRDSKYCG